MTRSRFAVIGVRLLFVVCGSLPSAPTFAQEGCCQTCPDAQRDPVTRCCPRRFCAPGAESSAQNRGCPPGQHRSSGHCCGSGEDWVGARRSCVCLDPSVCGSQTPAPGLDPAPTVEQAAPPATGTVRVRVPTPGATIYLDDQPLEQGERSGVPAGHHTLRASAPGHAEATMELELSAGETARIELPALQPASPSPSPSPEPAPSPEPSPPATGGRMRVTVAAGDPEKYQVRMEVLGDARQCEGEVTFASPCTISGLAPGTTRVSVSQWIAQDANGRTNYWADPRTIVLQVPPGASELRLHPGFNNEDLVLAGAIVTPLGGVLLVFGVVGALDPNFFSGDEGLALGFGILGGVAVATGLSVLIAGIVLADQPPATLESTAADGVRFLGLTAGPGDIGVGTGIAF